MHDAAERWLSANDPSYLKYRQGWKHLTRLRKGSLDYQAPFGDLAVGGALNVESAWHEAGVPWFDFREEYEKKPSRKRDRHKGSRASYMREYRARRKAEAESA